MKNIVKIILALMLVIVSGSCGRVDGNAQIDALSDGNDSLNVMLTAMSETNDQMVDLIDTLETVKDSVPVAVVSEPPLTEASGRLCIAMVGDIMMGTTFPDDTPRLPANGGKNLFDAVKPVLAGADVVCGNLEGVLMEPGGIPRKMGDDPKSYYIFRTPTSYVNNLIDAGFDFVSVANNHANDMQDGGRRSTQRVLSEAGIAYAGQINCPTAVIEREGKKIGIAAFGHSSNTCHTWKYDNVRRTVSGLDSVCDIVIVSFHGGAEGAEYGHVPHEMESYLGEQRGNVEKFAHAAIDAGADVVYGHGPHVTRAVELYKDRFIVYSLGNFCTPYRVSLTGIKGYAPVATVEVDDAGRFIGGKIHSFIQQPGKGPMKDVSHKVARHMRQLSEADFPSSPLRIADDGTITLRREEQRR